MYPYKITDKYIDIIYENLEIVCLILFETNQTRDSNKKQLHNFGNWSDKGCHL